MSRERKQSGSFRYYEMPAYRSREHFERFDPLSPTFRPLVRRSRPSDIVEGNPILEPRSSLLESRALLSEQADTKIERRFFSELR